MCAIIFACLFQGVSVNIEMLRYGNTPQGVFGEITIKGEKFKTVERPYLDNKPYISSVPSGEYNLVPHMSRQHGETWALVNHDLGVYHWPHDKAERFAILIHVANKPSELAGCIGVGERLGALKQDWAVLNSRLSIQRVMALLSRDIAHTITIRWAENGEM